MRAAFIETLGGPEQLKLAELPTPEPGLGEVLVRVACAGVNPGDWKDIEGLTARWFTFTFPYVAGASGSGVVDKVGPGATWVKKGDRVIHWNNKVEGRLGTYAEYAVVYQDRMAPLPRNLDFAQGAAIPVAALSAWQALFDKGNLRPGERILIHGASGGLGSFAVQFAKSIGAEVAATCSTPNIDYVKGLGADRVIDYRREDIGGALRAWAPEGVKIVFDAVGVSTLPNALDLLRPGGFLVNIITLTDDGNVEADVKAAAARGFTKILHTVSLVEAAAEMRQIGALIEQGVVRMPPVKIFPLEEVAKAFQLQKTGHVRGKLVLRIADL